jgi:hypothetical protein
MQVASRIRCLWGIVVPCASTVTPNGLLSAGQQAALGLPKLRCAVLAVLTVTVTTCVCCCFLPLFSCSHAGGKSHLVPVRHRRAMCIYHHSERLAVSQSTFSTGASQIALLCVLLFLLC